MKQMLVDQQNITRTRVETTVASPLEVGQARLRLKNFALTANNVTYAASGFVLGYWQFFPSGQEGLGLVPVWGTAEVVESLSDTLALGTRLYGFYPLAEELVITPRQTSGAAIEDITAHRSELPSVYNRYLPISESRAEQDHLRALLQPLLATSWLLADWLADNDYFRAKQIIIGSSSSKTGLGLCRFLGETSGREYRIIGLTSDSNRAFVDGLKICDQVLSYDQINSIPKVPSVYVDMSGNTAVKLALHSALAQHLKHSAAVGISHWDKFAPNQKLPGVKPQFFFAPAQIAKRRDDWGPGVVETRIADAWKRVADTAGHWMNMQIHQGIESAPAVYSDLASGRANPRDGHVITL